MTANDNEIKILGKYALNEVYVKSLEDSEKEGFFLEETDEQVFPTLWDEAFPFSSDGYAAVKDGELWGFINVMGELVVPNKWKDVRLSQVCFPEGLCAIQDDHDLWGFVNAKGEVILPCQWQECRDFRNGECAVKDDKDQWSYIDKKGNFVRTSKWKEIGEWDEENGFLSVQDESGLWGFADKDDCLLIPCQWKETHLFEKVEEPARNRYVCWVMNQEGLWGCIDKRGKVVIACSWTDCFFFSEGLCGVKGDNGLWGAIDVHGNLVIPTEWDEKPLFQSDEALVFKNGNPYKIDRNGKVINNFGNVFDGAGSTKYKAWGALVVVIILGIGLYALADEIGYANYNPIRAYSLFSQQWLKWLVALLGGLHTYDLLLPLGLVAGYLYKRFSPKDDFAEWGTHGRQKQKDIQHEMDKGSAEQNLIEKWTTKLFGSNSSGMNYLLLLLFFVLLGGIWSNFYIILAMGMAVFPIGLECYLWKSTSEKITHDRYFSSFDASVVILSMLLSLRLIYFVLFFVNYQTANAIETKEMQIVSADYESHRNSKSYYFYIEVDNSMPYELNVSKDAYKNYKEGRTSKVLADVRTGKLGFSFISDFKTQKPTEEIRNEQKSQRKKPQREPYVWREIKYIEYRLPGVATQVHVDITSAYHDVPELHQAASMALFGEECTNVYTAYEHFVEKHKPIGVAEINQYPYLGISFMPKYTGSIPCLHAEMFYAEKEGDFVTMCDKDFCVDLLHKRLITIDNVLEPSEAKIIKEKAKGAEVSLHIGDDGDIMFSWSDGKGHETSELLHYDGSQKFTADFRELMESVKE